MRSSRDRENRSAAFCLRAIKKQKPPEGGFAPSHRSDKEPTHEKLRPHRRGGRRYAPYAFTEHGALMLSSVLRSPEAESVGLLIVRAFVQLREMLSSHKELALKLEALERKAGSHDQAITSLLEAIRQLMFQPAKQSRPIGFMADLKPGKNLS